MGGEARRIRGGAGSRAGTRRRRCRCYQNSLRRREASAAQREGGRGRAEEGRRRDTGPEPRCRRPAAPAAGASAVRATSPQVGGEARWPLLGPEDLRPPSASGAGHREAPRSVAGWARRCGMGTLYRKSEGSDGSRT